MNAEEDDSMRTLTFLTHPPLRIMATALAAAGSALVVALSLAAPAAAATVVDQQCAPTAASENLPVVESATGSPGMNSLVQTFRPGRTGRLEKISLPLYTEGGSANVVVRILPTDDTGTLPSEPTIADSSVTPVSAGPPGGNVDFSFPDPVNLTAGQPYAFRPYKTLLGVGTPYVSTCDGYPGGILLLAIRITLNPTDCNINPIFCIDRIGWSGGSSDMAFATYMEGRETAPANGTTPYVSATFPRRNGRYSKRRLRTIRGRVRDAGNVSRVRVSLRKRSGARCLWLTRRRLSRRSCRRPVYLRARGVARWRVRLRSRQRRSLRRGRYVLTVRLEDADGNRVTGGGTTRVRFRVRR